MTRTVELYWDPGSTNTYFAFKLLQPVLRRTGARLELQPFNLGYVFRKHDYALMEEPPAKLTHRKDDLMRWARKYQLPFRFPDVFPIKTSRILRGALAMRQWGLELAYTEAVLDAYWEQNDHQIAGYPRLRQLVEMLGASGAAFERLAESDSIRQQLIEITDAGLARGVFGVPTLFVGDEMFWGKDRMDFVEDALNQ